MPPRRSDRRTGAYRHSAHSHLAPEPGQDVDQLDIRILRLLHDGHTEAAIARMSSLSYRSVQRRIRRMKEEFAATSRFALGAAAERRGLLGAAVMEGRRCAPPPAPETQ